MRTCCLVVLLGVAVSISIGGIGQWKTYTPKREVRAVAVDYNDSTLLWVATSGGMFSFRLTDHSFREYTTSEELRTIDLTAITVDNRGAVWIGASNGFLHRYFPPTDEWQYISQIAEDKSHGSSKRINELHIVNDILYILSDIGVSLFSISKMMFGDNYLHSMVTKSKSIEIFDRRIWVATENGIANTPDTNLNPSAPNLWQKHTTAQGLPSNMVSKLGIFNDQLLAATTNGMAYFNGTSWSTFIETMGKNILGFKSLNVFGQVNQSLIYITPNELWVLSNGSSAVPCTQFSYVLSTILSPTIIGTETAGLLILRDSTWSSVFPAGPPSTRFIGIAVDQKGVVWSGTGKSNGSGFMSFDGKKWRLYDKQQYPEFRYNDFYKINLGLNNSKWIIGWGPGIVLVDDTGKVVQTFNTKNGIPWCIPNDREYAVVTGAAVDQNGITWITSRTPPGDTILMKYKQDETFDYLGGYIFSNNNMQNPLNFFTDVVIDNYGTKWFGNFTRFEPKPTIGFFYYNEHYALPNTVGGWGKLTLSPDNVRCLAVDKEGSLWTGSDKGITIIFNTSNPQASVAIYHPLQDQVIQSIVVDAVNNKWVATQQGGVFVLSPDGTSIVERYTVENTGGKLLDDDINSIAIDGNAGTVYFGTEKGLSSLTTTTVVNPKQSFEEITFFPNPLYLPSSGVGSKCHDQVLIGGLVRSSSIKILTVGGSLVREIQTEGSGEECWDGKDEKGNYVASGIYIVIAFSEDGEQVSKGKIAIIRK